MKIFELEIPKLWYTEFIQEIKADIMTTVSWDRSHARLIFTPNPEICLKTLEDREFLEALKQADYLTSDGIGLYLAYQINDSRLTKIFLFFLLPYYIFNILFRKKFLYQRYGDRICWSDLTIELVKFAQKEEKRIAIIDPYFPEDTGKCEAQKNFREKLLEKFPHLLFDFYILTWNNSLEVLDTLKHSDAEICFVTLGMKKQELFCLEVQENCTNIKLAAWVGSSFDYYTWFQKRAPKIWRESWFEWLYRIFTSPNKLKRLGRISQALIVFPFKILFFKNM